jgi:membrane dipeptidase
LKVVDLHSDILTDVAFRREKGERNVFERVHLPSLLKGGVSGIIGVIWVEPIFKVQKIARFYQLVKHVFDDLRETSKVKIVTSPESLLNTLHQNQFFVYLGIEGLSFLEEWDDKHDEETIDAAFHELNHKSIRHSILVWNDTNFIATGSGNDKNDHSGLSTIGRYALKQLERNQWMIDVSHLDEVSFWDVIHTSSKPILASHSNVYKLCPHERNLTDQQIIAIANSGGLIGVNAYGSFVDSTKPTLSKVVDHISYIADLVGMEHVGLGFDFVNYLQDYNLGSDMSNMTEGLEDATKIPKLFDEMTIRGFTSEKMEKVAFENFYHYLCNIQSSKWIGGNVK